MLDRFLNDDAAVQRMRALPLGSQLDSFTAVLSALGYARASIRERLWTLAALGKWLKRRGLAVTDLRYGHTAAFLKRRAPRRLVRRGDAATLRLFLEHLEANGIIPASPPINPTPLEQLKARYEAHLQHDRGLSPVTGPRHWCLLGRFLRERFGAGPIEPRAITADDITRYVLGQIPAHSPASAHPLLAAPDVGTWMGRRDRALLLLAIRIGLRVSELTHVRCGDLVVGTGAHLCCAGKGRKQRCTPLPRDVVGVLTAWLRERNGQSGDPLFATVRGNTLSRDAVERLVARHVQAAHDRCPSLTRKRVSPHVLRHTAAMELLRHGVDRAVIALWLGHESVETTQMYLHADMRLKEQALARTTPTDVKPGRYRPCDQLLAFLERL